MQLQGPAKGLQIAAWADRGASDLDSRCSELASDRADVFSRIDGLNPSPSFSDSF